MESHYGQTGRRYRRQRAMVRRITDAERKILDADAPRHPNGRAPTVHDTDAQAAFEDWYDTVDAER